MTCYLSLSGDCLGDFLCESAPTCGEQRFAFEKYSAINRMSCSAPYIVRTVDTTCTNKKVIDLHLYNISMRRY